MKDGPLGNSFRDPSGFVFKKNRVVYRQINRCYRNTWEKFISSGLYGSLTKSGDLISHELSPYEEIQTDHGWIIIKPDPVDFWTYPFEWCFGQLKDAAITTLRIQKTALDCGMSMKDASAYNIQFVDGRPILIDSLSFEFYDPEKGWNGFRQFCMHFLAPLALMSMTDYRLGQLFRVHLDGVPFELSSALLPWKSWLKFSTLIYIHLQAINEKKNCNLYVSSHRRNINLNKMKALIENLESSIKKLNLRLSSSWLNYYNSTLYGPDAFRAKGNVVSDYIKIVAPETVWDLGANKGHFSQIAAKHSRLVVSFDSDMASVESNYRECRTAGYQNILPLCLDLTNPSPCMGWSNNETMNLLERGPADLILSLALIHHLAIANNIPLDLIAKGLASLTKHLIIEFIPKSDPMVEKLLSHREDIFANYDQKSFECIFSKYFRIIKSTRISCTSRSIYLMQSMFTKI